MTDLVIDYEGTRPDLRLLCHEFMAARRPSGRPLSRALADPFHRQHPGRLLIVQGLRDPNVTPENMRVACRALDAAGKPYDFLTFDDEGHGIYKPKNRRILYTLATSSSQRSPRALARPV